MFAARPPEQSLAFFSKLLPESLLFFSFSFSFSALFLLRARAIPAIIPLIPPVAALELSTISTRFPLFIFFLFVVWSILSKTMSERVTMMLSSNR